MILPKKSMRLEQQFTPQRNELQLNLESGLGFKMYSLDPSKPNPS